MGPYQSLSDIFSVQQLPGALALVPPGTADVLENIYYRNLDVQLRQAGAFAAAIELVSYQDLRFEVLGTGFYVVLNPEQLTADGVTLIPLSLGYRLGISALLPQLNLLTLPTTATELFALVLPLTGMTESSLLIHALVAFEDASADNYAALHRFATKANAAFGSSNGLAVPAPSGTDFAPYFAQLGVALVTGQRITVRASGDAGH